RDPELSRRKISVQFPANMLCENGAHIPLLRQSVKLTRAHLHHRELARNEKSVESNQRGDNRELANDNPGRIPASHHIIGHLHYCEKINRHVHVMARVPPTSRESQPTRL